MKPTMEVLDNKQRISPTMIPILIRTHWPAKEALHLTGEPSTWKSVLAKVESVNIAKDVGRKFLDWNKSTMEEKEAAAADPSGVFIFADVRALETDIGELRLQDMQNGKPYITFKYNLLFVALSNPSAMGVLFLDELNNAPNLQKMQMYKLINDRAIGDIPLSDGVLVISAGNEAEHSYGTTEDPVPLVLRRANYFIAPPTKDEFLQYAVLAEVHPLVTGYIAFAGQNTHDVEYDNPDPVGQPCSRTWTKLSNVLKANERMPADVMTTIAVGYVGQKVGLEFGAYAKLARKVNIDEIIQNPERIKDFNPTDELSLLYAVLTGVVEKYRTDKKVLEPAIEVSMLVREELGVYMMRQIKQLDKENFMFKLAKHKKFKEWTEKYQKYFLSDY